MARPGALVAAGAALNVALAGVAGALVAAGDEGKPPDPTEWLGDVALVLVAGGAALAVPGRRLHSPR